MAGLEAALAWLDDRVNYEAIAAGTHPTPTLDRMVALCDLLGQPQRSAPVLHITGTNGKGSTARMATSLLMASGLSVGTFTSPDLQRINERLSRDNEPIGDEELAEALTGVATIEAASGVRPTRFEALTLAAFRWFGDLPVDAVVLEVGMAGRWDATNVADGVAAVITNVTLDHTDVFGSRRDIAEEKAGIVKPGSTLVVGETDPDLLGVFEGRGQASTWLADRDFAVTANRLAVGGRALDMRTPGATYEEVYLPLHGAHQGTNAVSAVAAVEAFFGRPLDDAVVRAGLGEVTVPGRFEVVRRNPLIVLDCAHNPAGAAAAAATMDDLATGGDRVLVVGMNRGHGDPADLLAALDARRARTVVATAPDWPRAIPPEEMAAAAASLGIEAMVVPVVADAVDAAIAAAGPSDAVLVTGSLYVVGAARTALLGATGR